MGKAHTYAYKTMPLFYEDLPFEFGWWECAIALWKTQRAKEDMGFEYATQNVEDLFDDDNIQIINICTPTTCTGIM